MPQPRDVISTRATAVLVLLVGDAVVLLLVAVLRVRAPFRLRCGLGFFFGREVFDGVNVAADDVPHTKSQHAIKVEERLLLDELGATEAVLVHILP